MAATLTLAGLLLVRVRDRIAAHTRTHATHLTRMKRLARIGPTATAALVLLVGLGLTARAAAGL
ncbi:hypothetical protein [Streptomyces sp. SYSU K217416]